MVAQTVERQFRQLRLYEPAAWCRETAALESPRKADQDRLDAMLCLYIAINWRLGPRSKSIMLGDLNRGYMVLPTVPSVRERLEVAAAKYQVPIDGEKRV
jgi:predicted RNase H-like nuclease